MPSLLSMLFNPKKNEVKWYNRDDTHIITFDETIRLHKVYNEDTDNYLIYTDTTGLPIDEPINEAINHKVVILSIEYMDTNRVIQMSKYDYENKDTLDLLIKEFHRLQHNSVIENNTTHIKLYTKIPNDEEKALILDDLDRVLGFNTELARRDRLTSEERDRERKERKERNAYAEGEREGTTTIIDSNGGTKKRRKRSKRSKRSKRNKRSNRSKRSKRSKN